MSTRALLVLVAAAACRRDAPPERHYVAETVLARVNSDAIPDLVVVYDPSFADKERGPISTIEAYDGATGAVLWTDQLDGYMSSSLDSDQRRTAVVGAHLVLAGRELRGPRHDSTPIIHAHDITTGKKRWKRDVLVYPPHEFMVWPVEDFVLVEESRRAPEDHPLPIEDQGTKLVALDIATGTPRWSTPLPQGFDMAPQVVDGQIVMFATGQLDASVVSLIDPKTGVARHVECAGRFLPVATRTGLYVDVKEAEYQRALARVDVRTATVTRVTSLEAEYSEPPALYGDIIIESSYADMAARRLDEQRYVWSTRADRTGSFSDIARKAPDAGYLRDIRGRYLPTLTRGSGERTLQIIDLTTGRTTWTSKPFKLDDDFPHYTPFIVVGAHYYFDLETPDGDVLISFDGARGVFDGAYSVRTQPGAMPKGDRLAVLDPWSFHDGYLVGSRRDISWVIDLKAQKLALVHPPGRATLIDSWPLVTAALGAVPR